MIKIKPSLMKIINLAGIPLKIVCEKLYISFVMINEIEEYIEDIEELDENDKTDLFELTYLTKLINFYKSI